MQQHLLPEKQGSTPQLGSNIDAPALAANITATAAVAAGAVVAAVAAAAAAKPMHTQYIATGCPNAYSVASSARFSTVFSAT